MKNSLNILSWFALKILLVWVEWLEKGIVQEKSCYEYMKFLKLFLNRLIHIQISFLPDGGNLQ